MKDVVGFEGLYAITSCGKVWSYKSKIFLAQRPDKDGYMRVNLAKNKKQYTRFIHRLVAEAYIPNPENKPQVNHKNEFAKTDNNVNNLEWATSLENINYGTRTERAKATRNANPNAKSRAKKVYCVELDRVFEHGTAAARELGLDQGSVSKNCNGKLRQVKGYHFKFVEEDV